MLKAHFSNFRMITEIFRGVRIFTVIFILELSVLEVLTSNHLGLSSRAA